MLNKNTRFAILAISIVIPLAIFALWSSETRKTAGLEKEQQIDVLVSFHPVYEFVKEVVKEKIQVSTIVPPGIEPHDWEPTIQDIQKMQNAKMIIINGAGFEKWLDRFISNNPDVLILDTSKGIELLEGSEFTEQANDDSVKDPHIWLDPILAKIQTQNIANGLSIIDPQNERYYQQNAQAYNQRLDQLDNKIRLELSTCSKKDFLAFHNAFSYFSKEYDLKQHTIVAGLDPNEEPTAELLEQLIQDSQRLNIDVVFTEEAVDPRVSKVLSDEIGGKVLVLSPIEIEDNNADYIQRMENNLQNLKEALCP